MLTNKNGSPETVCWGQEAKAVTYAKYVAAAPIQQAQSPPPKEEQLTDVAIYLRYSSDMQNAATIASQREAILKYCEANKMRIVMEYVDEALSGTNDRRKAFRKMMDDAANGVVRFSVILAYKLDRISRKVSDHLRFREYLEDYGIKIIAVEGNFDDENPEGWLGNLFQIGLSEYYIKNLRRDTLRGLFQNARECKHTGGKPPLGYKLNKETLKLEIDEEQADSVRRIFTMAAEGKTYREIADTLNKMERTNAYGRPFSDFFLDTLKQRKYIGEYVFNLTLPVDKRGRHYRRRYRDESEVIRIPGGVPRIVSDELFYKVQRQLEHRQRIRPNKRRKYLLSGFTRCECGYAMSGSSKPTGRNKNQYYYYRCSCPKTSKHEAHICKNSTISMALLNEFVINSIRSLIHDPEGIVSLINESLTAEGKKANVKLYHIEAAVRNFDERVRKSTPEEWSEILFRLVKEIRVTKEQAELYIRLNAFIKYSESKDLLCMFTKDRIHLRKLAPYVRKKRKEKEGNETETES